jgi:putative hemolysin
MLKELHSIYPVYGENYDDIVGVVNLKIFCSF